MIIATTWTGFQVAKRYADRPKQIRQLRAALSFLKTEVAFGTRPLADVCHRIAMREEGAISALFDACKENLLHLDGASTYECFGTALEKEWSKTVLGGTEKQIMLDLSRVLGVSDREDQLHHLRLADENLKTEETKALDDQVRYEKMYKTMGVLVGALVIILMY